MIVDTAPHADQAALRAAKAAALILVPCRPSILDIDAIGATLELCQLAKREARVVLNAAPIRSRVTQESAQAVLKIGGEVSPVVVRERVAFRHALVDGRVAQEFEPGGLAAAEIVALFDTLPCKHVDVLSSKRDSMKASKRAGGLA